MLTDRRALAQLALLIVIGAMFLTWSTDDGSITGTETGEGQLAALAALATVALAQVRFRPAWIGAALIVATLVRQLGELGDATGIGLWIGTGAAVVATSLLVWELFASIPRPSSEADPDDQLQG